MTVWHDFSGHRVSIECLERLAQSMRQLSYPPHEEVYQRGQSAERFFFVVSGRLSLLSSRKQEIGCFTEGTLVGLEALKGVYNKYQGTLMTKTSVGLYAVTRQVIGVLLNCVYLLNYLPLLHRIGKTCYTIEPQFVLLW